MMSGMTSDVVVRPVEPADREAWQQLFHAYRTFYEYDEGQDVVDRVWGWIHDDAHETNALVAELDGEVVGFAHHREFARPSSGKRGLYLDDLFARPDVRGQGVGRALITHLGELGQGTRLQQGAVDHRRGQPHGAAPLRRAWPSAPPGSPTTSASEQGQAGCSDPTTHIAKNCEPPP